MKKLFLAIALVMGLSGTVGAQDVVKDSTKTDSTSVAAPSLKEIDLGAVPEAINSAVAQAYSGYSIKQAYTGTVKGTVVYELRLADSNNVEKKVYFTADGKEIH